MTVDEAWYDEVTVHILNGGVGLPAGFLDGGILFRANVEDDPVVDEDAIRKGVGGVSRWGNEESPISEDGCHDGFFMSFG